MWKVEICVSRAPARNNTLIHNKSDTVLHAKNQLANFHFFTIPLSTLNFPHFIAHCTLHIAHYLEYSCEIHASRPASQSQQ